MKTLRIAAVASLALAPVALAAPAHAADATVSILHGVPGATVDVYANGKELLTDFKPGTLTDPLMLPEGTYDLKVTAAGAGANGAAVIEANDVQVPGDANVTVVAHLDEAGKPVLTPFVNDTSAIDAGKARITVRHTAAAPAVDVRANGAVAFKDLTNPNEAKADLARRHDQRRRRARRHRHRGHRPGRREPQGRHQHHRLRLGQRSRQEPRPRHAGRHRHALRPRRRAGWRG